MPPLRVISACNVQIGTWPASRSRHRAQFPSRFCVVPHFHVLHDDLWHREFRRTISYAHLWRALHMSEKSLTAPVRKCLPVLGLAPSSSRVGALAVSDAQGVPGSKKTPVRRDLGRLTCLTRSGAQDLSAQGLRKEKHRDPRPTAPKKTARTGSVLGQMLPFWCQSLTSVCFLAGESGRCSTKIPGKVIHQQVAPAL